eukprot:gene17873-12812_t
MYKSLQGNSDVFAKERQVQRSRRLMPLDWRRQRMDVSVKIPVAQRGFGSLQKSSMLACNAW